MYQQTTNFLCYFSYDYYGDFIIRLLLRWLVESWSCCPWRINEILNLNGPLGRSSHLSNVFLSIVQQEFLENWRYLFRLQSRRNSVAFKSVTAPDWHWIRRVDSIWSDYTLIAIYSQKPYFRFPTFIFPIPYLQIFLIKHFVRIFLDPWKTKRNGQKQKTKIKANDKSIWWNQSSYYICSRLVVFSDSTNLILVNLLNQNWIMYYWTEVLEFPAVALSIL